MRQDAADECAALDATASAVLAAVEQAGRAASADARVAAELLDALVRAQAAPVALTLGDARDRPLYVTSTEPAAPGSTVALSGDDRELLHEHSEQQRYALWALFGLILVLLVEPTFRRVWQP